MQISDTQAKKLLSGTAKCKFSQLGFSLLITRLISVYQSKSDSVTLQECTKEINAFLAKYMSIMKSDYELLAKL